MTDMWQLPQVQSGALRSPLSACILTLLCTHLEWSPVSRGHCIRTQALQRAGSCLTGTHKLYSLPRSVIIDVLATGVLDRMDPEQLLSSAVRFSNVIYRVMLTVDFLPAIKVA